MMKKQIQTALLFLTVIISFSACKKKSKEPLPPETNRVDIYAAGREGNVAKYWKNGNPVTLGSST